MSSGLLSGYQPNRPESIRATAKLYFLMADLLHHHVLALCLMICFFSLARFLVPEKISDVFPN